MRVPSDFQIPVTSPRSGVLEALGLKVGETVNVRVVAQNANGSTLVQLGNQQVSLNLPQQFPPGTELQFEVKAGGAKPELVLLAASAKPGAAPVTLQTAQPQPLVIVSPSILNQSDQSPAATNNASPTSASAQAQASSTAAQSATPSGTTQPAPPPNAAYPRPPLVPPPGSQGANASATPALAATSGGAAPAVAQLASVTLPPQLGAALSLVPGQAITARVAPPNPLGQPQVTIGGQTVALPNVNLPAPGTALQGQVITQNGQLTVNFQTARPGVAPYPTLSQTGSATQTGQTGTSASQSAPTPANIAQAIPASNLSQPLAPPNLHQVATDAAVRQDSLGKLITTITGLSANAAKDLPPNVAQAARQLSAAPLKLDGQPLTADALKDAVARSGVFLESALARGVLPQTGPQGDMKNMLMLLRNALGSWLDGEPLPQPQGQKPAPPMRGAPPRPDGQTQQNPMPDGVSAREAGRHMLAQTESALSRMRLFQLSSLPEAAQRGNPAAAQELHFELPLLFGGQAAMAQFQVNRDGANDSDPSQRGWQMSFAVHFNVIGAVGAKVSFRARKTGVAVWAENETTAEVLEEMLPELVDGLTAQGLELSSVRVRRHAPDAPPVHAGGFVDSVS